jgi:hypothetical protein
MMSVSLWQHEPPIDEGGDGNVGCSDDDDGNGGDSDGVEATTPKPAPKTVVTDHCFRSKFCICTST